MTDRITELAWEHAIFAAHEDGRVAVHRPFFDGDHRPWMVLDAKGHSQGRPYEENLIAEGFKPIRPTIEGTDTLDGKTIHQWKAQAERAEAAVTWYIRKVEELETQPTDPAALIQAAWDAAHEVPDGAVIPAGTAYIMRWHDGYSFTYRHHGYSADFCPTETGSEFYQCRTLTPLPEPEPEWMTADYVWADYDGERGIFSKIEYPGGKTCWANIQIKTALTRDDMTTLNPVPVKTE